MAFAGAVAHGQLQFYAVALGIGLALGGTPALTRSLFSQMVPPGREAEYLALYEVGEKGTSWLGRWGAGSAGPVTRSLPTG